MRCFGYKISLRLRIFRPDPEIPIDVRKAKAIIGSHSQYYEDVFLASIFRGKENGYYIDIGANDPDELSNTKSFYLRGWRGINVEPNRILFEKFLAAREEDVNINAGIGAAASEKTFFETDPHTLSTFNKEEILGPVRNGEARIVSEKSVPIMTLRDLFRIHVRGKQVDFLSVDTEGFDYEVLSGNDWERNRPSVVVVEMDRDRKQRVHALLAEADYERIHFNGLNAFYVDRRHFSPV